VNAATLINAKVLEHKSWISGADEKGRAVSGHFESVDKGNSAGTGGFCLQCFRRGLQKYFYEWLSFLQHSESFSTKPCLHHRLDSLCKFNLLFPQSTKNFSKCKWILLR